VALAVGMAVALELAVSEQEEHARRLAALRDRFERQIQAGYPGAVVHGAGATRGAGFSRAAAVIHETEAIRNSAVERLPQTGNIAFPGLDGQVLLMALDLAGVACSVGSACSSGSTELSPTLRAMGLPNELVASSLRFSLGAATTEAEIDEAVRRILQVCRDLQA
jgi:cysteine desulfurase